MRRVMIGMAATLIAASPARAQELRACLQRLDAPTADSVRSTFAATVQSFNPRRPLPTTYAELVGEGLRQELKLPPDFVLPVFEADSIAPLASPSTKSWMAMPSMSVVFGVTVMAGKITRIRRIAGASSTPFDASVMNALMVLDSLSGLPPLPAALGVEPLEISVAIARVPQRETHPAITTPGVPTIPLFIVRSPAYPVTQRVVPGPDFSRFAPQPPTKREDEAVIVRVLVMDDGSVEPGSMQVTAYSSTGYIQSVFDMIPNWRFKPMQLLGCPVPAIEELTFTPAQKGATKP